MWRLATNRRRRSIVNDVLSYDPAVRLSKTLKWYRHGAPARRHVSFVAVICVTIYVTTQRGRCQRRGGCTMSTITKEIIEAAIAGFETQKQRIDEQISELRSMLGGTSRTVGAAKSAKGRRKLSPEALERIREGQRRRWAAARSESTPTPTKPKRKLSAAGRKAIVDALKRRWAAKRAADATSSGGTKSARRSTAS